MCSLVGGPSAQGGFGLGNVGPWVGVSSGGWLPQAMGEAGAKVRVRVKVRCVKPWPLK